MEIEVGEYVRTKNGIIKKIDKIEKCKACKENLYINKETIQDLHFTNSYHTKDITKHSKNITDLIKVNDIIVIKHPACKEIYYEHIWSDEYLRHIKDYLNEKSLILLQVLTHEQLEQNAYRLEEK